MGLLQRVKANIVTMRGVMRTLKQTTPIAKNPTRIFPREIEELAAKFGDAPALISDRETLTYRTLNERANRYARWALAQGIDKGDTVCLLMPNRPEYMAIWLGITRVGGVVALINTNLVGQALGHCISVVAPKHIIAATELMEPLLAARASFPGEAKIWVHGDGTWNLPRIDRDMDSRPGEALANDERRPLTTEDRALYIYTSGTTGLPKAANINHYRLMLAVHAFAGAMHVKSTDRMYNCLPLYHSAGGVAAFAPLLAGGSVAIREKFSASEFWSDVVRLECTLLQYIGELCRYLVNSAPHPEERAHRLRLACGNGLRADVWPEFKRRFAIPVILEFYGATEGNVGSFNFEGKVGAVGRVPWFLKRRFPTKIVRFDVEKEAPVRDADGLCVECAPGEIGEAIGLILSDPERPGARFEGYATAAETERKILRDAFAKGDAWFRTGDLMKIDADGYVTFIDRIGDTFRWKGENVATSEVSEAITVFPGIKEANVYGVSIAGKDGRAGMAAIVTESALDLLAFRTHLTRELPEYARPLFLRFGNGIEITATFKQKKVDLVKQGFDPSVTNDPIYFSDPRTQAFVRLDKALYDRIQVGEIRL